jgi:hypothetical protein
MAFPRAVSAGHPAAELSAVAGQREELDLTRV